MWDKIVLLVVLTSVLITATSAQFFESQGSELDGDTLRIELEEQQGWATLSLPVNGEIPISQITDDCNIKGNTAYGFEGGGTQSQMINGMRGYAVRLETDCQAQIDVNSVSEGLETDLPNNGWTVFSVPREMSVSELESNCDFNGYDGTNIYEITIADGNTALSSQDTLEPTGIYWIRVQGRDCRIDTSNFSFAEPIDGDGSDDGSDEDSSCGGYADPSQIDVNLESAKTTEDNVRFTGTMENTGSEIISDAAVYSYYKDEEYGNWVYEAESDYRTLEPGQTSEFDFTDNLGDAARWCDSSTDSCTLPIGLAPITYCNSNNQQVPTRRYIGQITID